MKKEFPDNEEIAQFVESADVLLSAVMSLRGEGIDDDEYYRRAVELKESIEALMHSPARHPGISGIQ